MRVILGAIADDFTGATDLASMLARAGMRTALVLGMPRVEAAVPEAEAVVVALKSRTAPVGEAIAETVASWRWLASAGAAHCFFKYCSTFDSTPNGNIGPVAEALMAETGAAQTIYCPAMPENGRTVYQGKLFVYDQLLSESSMAHHPLTPMTDADLRRCLGAQLPGTQSVGLVAHSVVSAGTDAVRAALSAALERGEAHVIVDALTNSDLETVGRAAAGMPLVTGGSGLGLGLPLTYAEAGRLAGGEADRLPEIGGPGVLLSGSCSAATNAQVAAWQASGGRCRVLDPIALVEGRETVEALRAWLFESDAPALIAATQPPDAVRRTQEALGAERAAELVEATLSAIAVEACEAGRRRIVVAGGETSGAVAQALGIDRLRVGPSIAPGVPWCVGTRPGQAGAAPVALALKSGNFGAESFFADALALAP